ncbi:MAG TPA: DUF1552 domain-containing protein [Verrucomicrobiae bacterium]
MNKARGLNLSRRHFLRGLGACVALPAFTSVPSRLLAAESGVTPLATTATGAPLRTAFVYFPNGAIPASWWPKGDEQNFELHSTLSPLEPMRKNIQVLGGLNHENANPGPDGAGDHARANGTFLTGVRMRKSATDVRAGVSIDQVLAQKIGHVTRFPSLELTCDNVRRSGACDSGYACAYQFNLSWSSETTPVAPEGNPRLVFERLFGTGSHGERAESLARRQQEQRSILDFVMEDAKAMQRRLDYSDKSKLDQYLTGIREIETRIQKSERFGKVTDPAVETPAGVPTSYEEYVNLMFDMLLLAFQTDSTRVATFLLAHDGSNRPFGEIGIFEGHHDLSHHQNREDWIAKIAQIDQWYVRQFAKFLQKLETTKDVDGNSLLHNSQIVYGSGNADGNRHTHSNLPIILAGGGGGTLTPGRFVKHNSKPTSNLFLTMADRVGVSGLERFGDSSGRLTNV